MRRPNPLLICLLLACLPLTGIGCGSSAPAVPQRSSTTQTIRFDGVYRASEERGTSEKGEKIYKLIVIRFLQNGTAHIATSHGIFDVDQKTRQVACEGLLSDALLSNQGSQGPWILNVDQLKIILQWQSRGRWKVQDGAKAFEFDNDADPVSFSETHSGTVAGDTLTMRFEDPAFQSSGEYVATFVPVGFAKGE